MVDICQSTYRRKNGYVKLCAEVADLVISCVLELVQVKRLVGMGKIGQMFYCEQAGLVSVETGEIGQWICDCRRNRFYLLEEQVGLVKLALGVVKNICESRRHWSNLFGGNKPDWLPILREQMGRLRKQIFFQSCPTG